MISRFRLPATAAATRACVRVAALALALPMVMAYAPATLAAQEPVGPEAAGQRPLVTAVIFDGAESLDRSLLEDAIATEESRCGSVLLTPVCLLTRWSWAREREWLDSEEVTRDTERLELLYEIWGYPDARVTAMYDGAADRTSVRFTIEEGDPIRVASVEVEGANRFDPPIRLPSRFPLRPGEPYALPRLAMMEDWLLDRMAERGHPFGAVVIGGRVDEAAGTATLVLQLEPGPPAVFGPARITAEPPIERHVVRSLLPFEPGQPYSLKRLREAEKQLYLLPIVAQAILQPAVESPPAGDTVVVPVTVSVSPRKRRGIEGEGTLSSTDCLSLATFWRDRYFLGGPRLFGVGAGVSMLGAGPLGGGFPCTDTGEGVYAEPQLFVQASLHQPWPGQPATMVELGVLSQRMSSPGVYVLERHGATLGASRDFGSGLVGMARLAPSRNTMRASGGYFCGSYGVCTAEGIAAVTGPAWLSPLEATLSWAPAGVPRQTITPSALEEEGLWGRPGWRYWASAGLETAGAWTGSDWRYVRGMAEAAATRPFGLDFELATHARVAGLEGDEALPPFLRLYGGGLYSVRGFAENMLGPAALVASAGAAEAFGCHAACPTDVVIPPGQVSVRPTGGDAVLEASVEGRWWVAEALQVVAFVDAGGVRRDPLRIDSRTAFEGGWSAAVTPGVGIRVISSLGPIRLDLAFDPTGPGSRPLFADRDDLEYLGTVPFDRFTFDDPGLATELLRRFQIHVGIGQPF